MTRPIVTEEEAIIALPHTIPRYKPTPIPDVGIFDEPTYCVRINKRWAAHLIGVVDALDQPDTWVDRELNGIDWARDQVKAWILALLSETGCDDMACCEETNSLLLVNNYLIQYTTYQSISYQQHVLNQMLYDGTPQSIAPNVGENWSDATSSGDDALCEAIKNYIEQMIYEHTTRLNRQYLIGAAIIDAAVAAALALAVPTAGVSVGVGLILAGIELGIGGSLVAWNASVSDPNAKRKVFCCMFDSLKGSAVNIDTLKASVEDCSFDIGTHESNIAALVNNANQTEANYLAFLRSMNEARNTGDAGECDCCSDITDYEIVAVSGCTVTKIDDFHYRVQSSTYEVFDIPFAGPTRIFSPVVKERENRCVNYIGATQAQHDYVVLGCDSVEYAQTGGGGGSLLRYGWHFWRPDPDAEEVMLDTILEIACP